MEVLYGSIVRTCGIRAVHVQQIQYSRKEKSSKSFLEKELFLKKIMCNMHKSLCEFMWKTSKIHKKF